MLRGFKRSSILFFTLLFLSVLVLFVSLMVVKEETRLPSKGALMPETSFWENLNFVKMFGQRKIGETANDTVVANKIFHASGVLVDTSSRPNRIYVADTGNNRILGFKSLGVCRLTPEVKCTNETDCPSGSRMEEEDRELFKNPLACIDDGGEPCWDHNGFVKPPSPYSDAYLLQNSSRAEFPEVFIGGADPKLEFSYFDGKGRGDGFFLKVFVNNQEIWRSQLVAKDTPIQHQSISLPSYSGQKIFLSFVVDHNNSGDDNATILDPKLINNLVLNDCLINSQKEADIVLGQPDFSSASCNGDSNEGIFKNPSADTLCLMPFPVVTNTGEYRLRLNFAIDSEGNLYIPDIHNNRVLKFNSPFSEDKSDGKGDRFADFVWGQDDFNSNGINKKRGKEARSQDSLFISDFGIVEYFSSRGGVSVDRNDNVWVADIHNRRILRFPQGSKNADLVLGQNDFLSKDAGCEDNAPLNKLCEPILARVDPETGKLYVLDEETDTFRARILIFKPPFTNGMFAEKILTPKLANITNCRFKATGFIFNSFKEGEYTSGFMWLNDYQGRRIYLIDEEGNVLKTIGENGSYFNDCDYGRINGACDESLYPNCRGETFFDSKNFDLCMPGGQTEIDNANNFYVADLTLHRITRFKLPYEPFEFFNPQKKQTYSCPPYPNAGLFKGTQANAVSGYNFSSGSVGVFVFGTQLMVKDRDRFLVWDNYLDKEIGARADFAVGQNNLEERIPSDLGVRSFHTRDNQNRLWSFNVHRKLVVFRWPLSPGATPIANGVYLFWQDEPDGQPIDYSGGGISFDMFNRKLWISDVENHRLLRISNWQNPDTQKLLVDMVLGQPNKQSICCNQAQKIDGVCKWSWLANGWPNNHPGADTLCHPKQIIFDNFGNLYVVENDYEKHGNNRIIVFLAEDLRNAQGMFPNLSAKKVFVRKSFEEVPTGEVVGACDTSENQPCSPISLAFNRQNQMVVGNDGYYGNQAERHLKQLWFYSNPLAKNPDGSFVQGQLPDDSIRLPLGAAAEIMFDEHDNLIVQDHTWPRVWVVNLSKDPQLLPKTCVVAMAKPVRNSGPAPDTFVQEGKEITLGIEDTSLELSCFPHQVVFSVWERQEATRAIRSSGFLLNNPLRPDDRIRSWTVSPNLLPGAFEWRANLKNANGQTLPVEDILKVPFDVCPRLLKPELTQSSIANGQVLKGEPIKITIEDKSSFEFCSPHDVVFSIWKEHESGKMINVKSSKWQNDILTEENKTASWEFENDLQPGNYELRANLKNDVGFTCEEPLSLGFTVLDWRSHCTKIKQDGKYYSICQKEAGEGEKKCQQDTNCETCTDSSIYPGVCQGFCAPNRACQRQREADNHCACFAE